MKRIVTVQDISCVGKCSLTVALPIISAMGVETSVIPTAVLSTHTMFQRGFTCHDLTGELRPIWEHWQREGITFDAVYTGYLGSFEQLGLMREFFRLFGKEGTHIVVDPVMADHGKLYPAFDMAYAKEMASLCGEATVVVPNITEACLMLGIPYREDFSREEMEDMLRGLTDLGPRYAALTGVVLEKGRVGVMSYDRDTKTFFHYDRECLPVNFHGTGDIFASTLTGAMTRDMTVEEALTLAVDFTVESMMLTMRDPHHNTYGVNFEEAIPMLIDRLR